MRPVYVRQVASRIYAKLDVRSRWELLAMLRDTEPLYVAQQPAGAHPER